jgi:poly-gamma-glutamate biosynthesis protein PgsC/CapC
MVDVFAIGLVVAILVDETTGIKPGGYIVPGYLAVAMTEPTRLAATLAIVLVVIGVLKVVERFMLLYGRRRFAFALLTGCLLKTLLATLLPSLGLAPLGLLVIGFVIPGLVAHSCDHQGLSKTLASLVVATVLTKLVAMAVLG